MHLLNVLVSFVIYYDSPKSLIALFRRSSRYCRPRDEYLKNFEEAFLSLCHIVYYLFQLQALDLGLGDEGFWVGKRLDKFPH